MVSNRVATASATPSWAGLGASAYGAFDAAGDFVISDVETPRPWVNVLANEEYGLVISQMGGGFSWVGNCQLFRLTRWEQDLAVENYGRFVYLADPAAGEVWSTTFAPDKKRGSDRVTHGLGRSVFERELHGVRTRQTVFVADEGAREYWILDVANDSDATRELIVGSYIDWHLGAQGDWHREFHRLFVTTEAVGDTFVAHKRTGLREGTRERPEATRYGYFSAKGLDSVEWFGDKGTYLGPAGRLDRPEALLDGRPAGVTGRWDDPIAGLRGTIRLEAGQRARVVFVLGAEESREAALQVAAGVSVEAADELLAARISTLQRQCAGLQVACADPVVSLMTDRWLPNQALVGRILARCAYYQQGGAYGYRDQLQDSLMELDTDPAVTKLQIGRHAESMFADGGVLHWWHPGTTIAVDSHHSDTCMWLAHGTLDFLDETGDIAFLDHDFSFVDRSTRMAGERGTLLEHCLRGVRRALDRRSSRGLPLLGSGDWNDGLSHAGIDGKGESVWDAMFLYSVLTRLAPVLDSVGLGDVAREFSTEAHALQSSVEQHAWDGDWYIAGTDDLGRPFGSQTRPKGQIFLNPQTWSVLTGIGSLDRSARAMQAVKERLVKPFGALLLDPAYDEVDPYIGYITRYAPGLRENGGVYSHASTWAVQAFAKAGDPETAWQIWRGMCPPVRSAEDALLYAAEPYVMPGNVDGPDSPYTGRGGWTWYTGSAAWMRRALVHWVFGVRATPEGLLVDPNLPTALPGFELTRRYRGDTIRITVSGHGPYAAELDGKSVNTPVLFQASGESALRTLDLRGQG
ncbi:MAG: glycosyl transferase family 36 [Armatimonadetes bacterium]|nr:glycosyl transferase family 36 [Armatimonadota bacterium]